MIEEFKELKSIFTECRGSGYPFGHFDGYITNNINSVQLSGQIMLCCKQFVECGDDCCDCPTIYVIPLGSNGVCDKLLGEQEYAKLGIHGKWYLISTFFIDGYGYLFKHNDEVFLIFDKKTVVVT